MKAIFIFSTVLVVIALFTGCAGNESGSKAPPQEDAAQQDAAQEDAAQEDAAQAQPLPGETEAPYDLSAFSIPFAVNWPAAPITKRTLNVPADTSFRSAIARRGTRVIVAPGYKGSGGRVASDVDIVMANTATITSTLDFGSSKRIRIRGGKFRPGTGYSFLLAPRAADILLDNVNAESQASGFEMAINNSTREGFARVAIVNSTINTTGMPGGGSWIVHSQQRANVLPVHQDLIIANLNAAAGTRIDSSGAMRLQGIERCIIVDTALIGSAAKNIALRLHDYNRYVFIENFISYAGNNWGGNGGETEDYSVRHGTFNNMHMYSSLAFGGFALTDPAAGRDSGTFTNSTLYWNSPNVNRVPFLGVFTDGGGNTEVSWDGKASSMDFSVVPGKSTLADFGADH